MATNIEILTIPCLSDNYAFLIGNTQTGEAALVDVPEAAPINASLAQNGWRLHHVLLTHHHVDHVAGLDALTGRDTLTVTGAAADAHRLPPLDHCVTEQDSFEILGQKVEVLDVPGHTLGHIAFFIPTCKALFSADSLMAMGCGRLFEGTPQDMWNSLQKMRALPKSTMVYSGHEYTQSNLAFAQSLGEENTALNTRAANITAQRAANQPTVPSLLETECATNPFMRADDPHLQAALGMEGKNAMDVFTHIRRLKDNF